jgi:NTE family protein
MAERILRNILRCLAIALPLIFGSCMTHPINNQVSCGVNGGGCTCDVTGRNCPYAPTTGYRFHPEWKPDRDTLFIVAISGGGMRAAALAYGALTALSGLPSASGAGSLLDDIDLVSSVSGGSVAAAWYGLHGANGFSDPSLRRRFLTFLHDNGTLTLALKGLNPVALGSYLLTTRQRSDVLAEYFGDMLFDRASYDDINKLYKQEGRRGYVILNATDVGHETRFTFTQNNFDLICSDLTSMRLADAVAASADFPFAFSAVDIQNFSPPRAGYDPSNPDYRSCYDDKFVNSGPPAWIKGYDHFNNRVDIAETKQLNNLREARMEASYLLPSPGDVDLHLLDGGLADNLGMRSTLELADQPRAEPGIWNRLGHAPGYKKVKRVLYLVINARTKDDSTDIDKTPHPVGLVSTALRAIDTPMDSTTLDLQSSLSAELAAPGVPPNIKPYVVTVDFEMIPNTGCREWFWNLGTNWHLPDTTVDALISLGYSLVMNSPDLQAYYAPAKPQIPTGDFDFENCSPTKKLE